MALMAPSPLHPTFIAELDRDLVATSGTTQTVHAPFDGSVLHEVPRSTVADVTDAFARSRMAQIGWARSGFAHRRAVLLQAHDNILERREMLLDVLQSETGKTRGQAFEELFQVLGVTRYNALAARPTLRGERRRSSIPTVVSTRVRYKPKGIAGIITPWNYPLSLAAMDVVPALAAGCGVVQKADDQGALSVLALRQAFIDAGVPRALWAVVAGDGAEIGGAVTDEADYICFTGSTATGRSVAEKAGRRLVGASLELGGKNPLIVLDDVDPEKAAADAAFACFSSMGQLCVSIERIYVERAVAEPFIAAFAARVNNLVQGSNYDFASDVGSLTTPAQLARVQEHVTDAVAKGATVVAGGEARPELGPLFYAPTGLAGVTSEMLCFAGETFGPVVAITVVDNEEEAILAANSSDYGLNASVFSGSTARGLRIANAIDAGSINVNEGYRATFSSVDAPMGGVKQSGVGRRNGPEGLLRFVEPITIAHTTGLLQMPRTGAEWEKLSGLMLVLAATLKVIRRR